MCPLKQAKCSKLHKNLQNYPRKSMRKNWQPAAAPKEYPWSHFRGTLIKMTWLLGLKFWLLYRIKAINKSSITTEKRNPEAKSQKFLSDQDPGRRFCPLSQEQLFYFGLQPLTSSFLLLARAATLLTPGFTPNNSLPWLISVSNMEVSFSVY